MPIKGEQKLVRNEAGDFVMFQVTKSLYNLLCIFVRRPIYKGGVSQYRKQPS